MKKPYRGNIYNWKIRRYGRDRHVVGVPHGHPHFRNWIITSKIMKQIKVEEGIKVYTRNSVYILVGPEAKTEAECPVENYRKYGLV